MIPITTPAIARAALARHSSPAATGSLGRPTLATAAVSGETAGSLEAAATKAGETGRKVAISMIGLGFAIASIVLAFKRDFKEAVGVFAVGLVAIVLATPTGVTVLHNTVNSLFGSSS
jgi:L-lactate permease